MLPFELFQRFKYTKSEFQGMEKKKKEKNKEKIDQSGHSYNLMDVIKVGEPIASIIYHYYGENSRIL